MEKISQTLCLGARSVLLRRVWGSFSQLLLLYQDDTGEGGEEGGALT